MVQLLALIYVLFLISVSYVVGLTKEEESYDLLYSFGMSTTFLYLMLLGSGIIHTILISVISLVALVAYILAYNLGKTDKEYLEYSK